MAAVGLPGGRPRFGGTVAERREAAAGYLFVLVPMAVFFTFFIFPMIYAFYISFHDWGIRGKLDTVGFANYSDLFSDETFGKAVKNTLLYTAGVVPTQMALGLLLAVIVNQQIRGRTGFRGAYYFPAIASSAAITAIFIFLLASDGLFNQILGFVGIDFDKAWFSNSNTALPAIMGMTAWTTSATMMLFYLTYLQSINQDVYEAAAIDGATKWQSFWRITFPLLKPGHYFVAVLSVIGAMKVFDQAYIVSRGSGGPNGATLTVVLQLFRTAINDSSFGLASAMGVMLFAAILVFTLIQRQFFGRPEEA